MAWMSFQFASVFLKSVRAWGSGGRVAATDCLTWQLVGTWQGPWDIAHVVLEPPEAASRREHLRSFTAQRESCISTTYHNNDASCAIFSESFLLHLCALTAGQAVPLGLGS